MATLTYTANLSRESVSPKLSVFGQLTVHGQIETSVSYSILDCVLLKKVVPGEIIDEIRMVTTGHPDGAQFRCHIGDSNVSDRFATSMSYFPDLVYSAIKNKSGINYQYTATDTVRIKMVGAFSLTATSTLKFAIASHLA